MQHMAVTVHLFLGAWSDGQCHRFCTVATSMKALGVAVHTRDTRPLDFQSMPGQMDGRSAGDRGGHGRDDEC